MMWGLCAALVAGVLSDWRLAIVAGVLLLRYFVRVTRGASRVPWAAAGIALALAATCAAYGWSAQRRAVERIEYCRAALAGGATLAGRVASFPQARPNGTSFAVEAALNGVPIRALVFCREFDVSCGDSVRLVAQPPSRRRHDLLIEPAYLLGRGVDAAVRARPGMVRVRRPARGIRGRILWPVHRWLRSRLASGLGYAAPVSLGLVVGERGSFGQARRNHFKRLGIAHLIALSGFHLGLIAGLLLLVQRRLRWNSGTVLLAALCAYVGVVGEVVSLHRALVMSGAVIVASRVRRPIHPTGALAVATFVLVMARPTIVHAIGFQLSVVATLVVLAWVEARGGRDVVTTALWARRLVGWLSATVELGALVQLVLAPLLWYHFGSLSLAAPLATAVFVAPVCLLLVVSAVAPVVATLAPALRDAVYTSLDVIARAFDHLLALSATLVPDPVAAAPPDIALYYVGVWLFWTVRGRKWFRFVAILLIVASFAV